MDEAEAAARNLKHYGSGVQSIRIRYRERRTGERKHLPVSAPTTLEAGGGMMFGGGVPGGTTAPGSLGLFFTMGLNEDTDGGMDGPNGRTDCGMDLFVEEAQVGRTMTLLHQSGGRRIRIVGR